MAFCGLGCCKKCLVIPVKYVSTINRYCVCGVPIPADRCLCVNCAGEYTLKRSLWPDWLKTWMQNYQAELDYERKRKEISLDCFQE